MNKTIMMVGVDGVGKTYLLNKLNYDTFTASQLIREKVVTDKSKRVANISNNQNILIDAIKQRKLLGEKYILDGHCCLLDDKQRVNRIHIDTFRQLGLCAIIALEGDIEIICSRLRKRDNLVIDKELLQEFQKEEILYAKEIADELDIPFIKNYGNKEEIEELIKTLWR